MKSPDHVLDLLFDRGEKFFPAGELAAAAGLTPRRLNSALELLRQRGHELDFSPAQGLRLRRPVNLDAHLVERDLGTRRLGRNAICFDEVDSTNDVAFDCARQAGGDGLVVLAQSQRRGRGRHGRRWLSPRGANVLMSVLLEDAHSDLAHEAMTIAAGLAVAEAVAETAGLDCRLKWPNDVLLEGAKLAGVLVEVRKVARRRAVVIGIGINVNAHPPAGQTDLAATSIAEHTHLPAERLALVRAVLRRLDEWVHLLAPGPVTDQPADNVRPLSAGDTPHLPADLRARESGAPGREDSRHLPAALESLRTRWLACCGMINQRVTVFCAGRQYVGRVLDVSPLEGLALACDDGRTVHLPAAGSTILHG